MQHLAGVGAGRQQRVIAAPTGVTEAGALLGIAVDVADEAVDVDDQSAVARAGPGAPRTCERLGEQPVELADMPEREGAQERAERRRRSDPATSADNRPERSTSQSSMQSAPSTIA